MRIIRDDFRIVHHPRYEGLSGEYSLQWDGDDGWERVAFSNDQDALVKIATGFAINDALAMLGAAVGLEAQYRHEEFLQGRNYLMPNREEFFWDLLSRPLAFPHA